jgi:hypothetical protein
LFGLYPGIASKGVCADTTRIRELLARDLKIITVPVLLVLSSSSRQILQRVVGLESIKNWLWVTFNNSETIQEHEPALQDVPIQPMPMPMSMMSEPLAQMNQPEPAIEQGRTSLFQDDLLPPSETVYALKGSTSLKAAAEELQRQREQDEYLLKKTQ